ncbi:BMP family protein [Deinococcus sp. QL22]|uniref:BMP family lipoprotein n=1 Tax=Deinococcus sp. QL22 TaxID=2939437 RepID=UPI0035300F20
MKRTATARIASARRFTSCAVSLALAGAAVGMAQAAPARIIGLAFDVGGIKDGGFNQAAYEGAQRAAKELGLTIKTSQPKKATEIGQGVSPLVRGGSGLVIGVGYANNDAITRTASEFMDSRFAVVDDLPKGKNAVGLRFREQEGSFLAGFLAGKQSSTGIVGFVGGVDVPVIQKFRAGFAAGVKFACPNCRVVTAFVSKTSAGFNDPKAAAVIAASMTKQGVDVIFPAAGGSGQGVVNFIKAQPCIKAANLPAGVKFRSDLFAAIPKSAAYKKLCITAARPLFFIGVDTNQNALGDFDKKAGTLNHGLTSMVKRVDNAVYTIIKEYAEDRPWRGGDRSFGLSNGGVSVAIDASNRALIPAALETSLKKVEQLITDGVIKVPTQ